MGTGLPIHLTSDTQDLIDHALSEDQVSNDHTTTTLIPPKLQGVGVIRSKDTGVLAGVEVALAVFRKVDSELRTQAILEDGTVIAPGDSVGLVEGAAASILKGERTALNFLQRMSGIATVTSWYVKVVNGYNAKIVDTRKTIPRWRHLDKYAVRVGGGGNHRMNLADGILIKDNHIAAIRSQGLSLRDAIRQSLEMAPDSIKVEIEVTDLDELREALEAKAHIIMLDNMSLADMSKGVAMVGGRALIEASGGVNLETVMAVAETGVDLISVGNLTHSVQALDMSLDLTF